MNVIMTKTPHTDYFAEQRNPLPGDILYQALWPPEEIILAVNPRTTIEVVEGILQAAKDREQIIILELALSEMNLKGGYTGLTPSTFFERVRKAAENVGWYGYVLHADHITIKKGTEEEIDNVKREIEARVKAGYTSFAIDTSYLFNRSKTKIKDQLADIVTTSVSLFKFLEETMDGKRYGKEGEIGEIGIREFTEVEEALYFLDQLRKERITLNWLAVANGSKHGLRIDASGKIIPQIGINIKRTEEIVDALWASNYKTTIAQHGITGTPLPIIASRFPKGKISKGNVGTLWMLLVLEIIQEYEPSLYQRIYDWVTKNYGEEGAPIEKVFTDNSKYSIKVFFKDLERIGEDTKKFIKNRAYSEALAFFEVFGMKETAKKTYKYVKKNKIEY